MTIEQLVSVADAIIRDPTTGNGLMLGKANISSAIKLTMASTDVRGGIGNQLLYSYYHTREMTVDIEQASFGESILALNVGSTVSTGAVNVVQTDCLVTSASSAAQITLTPVGNVSVFLEDGSIQVVTANVKDITLSGAASQKITAVYVTSKSSDQIVVGVTTPPSIVDLTLIAEIRDKSTSGIKKYWQINIPAFQVAGNYDLSLTANGVSTEKLSGKALANTAADCTSGDYYAKVTYIPVSAASTYNLIAATPALITFSAASVPATQAITVYGIKNGMYNNTNVNSDCTFTKSGSAGANITVNATTGVVTAGSSASAGETALITVNYWTLTSGSIKDYVTTNVGA